MNTNADKLSNEPLNTHKGMIMQTKNGNVAHVLADPNMSQETEQAIAKMIDLVYNLDLEKKYENTIFIAFNFSLFML